MSIQKNWTQFQEELNKTSLSYGRSASDIQVMAVTKTRSVEEVKEAESVGMRVFGENRVGEAVEKFAELDRTRFPLYLIGHLQSNKVRKINSEFHGVHSIDSLELAQSLSGHRASLNLPLEILLQVNTSGEQSKSGFTEKEKFTDLAAQIAELPFLKLKGVMTMAPFVNDEQIVRNCFALCRNWFEAIHNYIVGTPILSMGMSSDFKWAIAEGSTMLRIGTTLFGGIY